MSASGIIPFWPTLVYRGSCRWHSEITELLSPYMTEEYDHIFNKQWPMCDSRSTIQYDASRENYPDSQGSLPWDKVEKHLTNCIDDFISQLRPMRPVTWYTQGLWLNKYGHKQWQEPHHHLAALGDDETHFSFAYMLKSVTGGNHRGGELVFFDPIDKTVGKLSQTFAIYSETNSGCQQPFSLREGEIMIFPSDITHWVNPNLAEDETRFTISGNIGLKI